MTQIEDMTKGMDLHELVEAIVEGYGQWGAVKDAILDGLRKPHVYYAPQLKETGRIVDIYLLDGTILPFKMEQNMKEAETWWMNFLYKSPGHLLKWSCEDYTIIIHSHEIKKIVIGARTEEDLENYFGPDSVELGSSMGYDPTPEEAAQSKTTKIPIV
jgi:hypothetical protein